MQVNDLRRHVITEAEYVEANQLFCRRPLRKELAASVWFAAALIAVGFALEWSWGRIVAMTVGGVVGGFLGAMLLRSVWVPARARRLFQQHAALRDGFTIAWDDAGLEGTSVAGHARTPWSHFRELREGDDVFILIQTDALFSIVPKSALGSAGEIDSFRRVAAQRIVESVR